MLPITNHRGFHIPHSLATAAAIVALVTALGWDASGTEAAGVESTGALSRVSSVAPTEKDLADESAPAARPGRVDCEPGVLSGLLPLVLPSVSGF